MIYVTLYQCAMFIRYAYLVCITLFINKVSLQVTVKCFVGDPCILPCLFTEDIKQVDRVFWRHNDITKVYEFSPGFSKEVKSDPRAESFPEEYQKGNYSIKIKKLETTDAGDYSCFITPADHIENMILAINPKDAPLIEEEPKRTDTKSWIIPTLILGFIVILCCVVLILRKRRLWFFKPH